MVDGVTLGLGLAKITSLICTQSFTLLTGIWPNPVISKRCYKVLPYFRGYTPPARITNTHLYPAQNRVFSTIKVA